MDESEAQLETLLAKTALRDRSAFEKLYALSSPNLYGVAFKMLKRKDWAEDALQEAFVKIWYNAGQYHQQKGNAISWMVSIVRYRAIDTLRAQRTDLDSDSVLENLVSENVLNEKLGSQESLEQGLDGCIDELQEKQKKSILMAFYDGYTHQELSQKLEVPLGTMKSWIRRSLERLKRCLDEV